MKKFLFPGITALAWLITGILAPERLSTAFETMRAFMLEMVQVLPFVLVLTALLSEWIPSAMVKKHLGHESGWRGIFFSFMLGTISAGPIYAAFPVCVALFQKGASIRNISIIISSWAVIKLPMLAMELSSLGLWFTLLRFVLTVPAIILIAWFMDKLIPQKSIPQVIEPTLPGKNCGACGHTSCESLLKAKSGDIHAAQESCILM